MEARVFNGGDVVEFCNVWRENADAFPERFRPADYGSLEAFLFGGRFFDPSDAFVVVRKENRAKALGFILASFAPNKKRVALDRTVGVLYAPILSTRLSVDERERAQELLMIEAEKRLRAQGARLVYAGGYPDGAPLFTGLYSPCSPPGLYVDDPDGALFERNGYVGDAFFNEYRLELDRYRVPEDQKFREAQNVYLEPIAGFWRSRLNWFDANVYAHFTSRQWLLTLARSQDDGEGDVLAGAATHAVPDPFPSFDGSSSKKIALGFLAVQRKFVRRRVGSVLLAGVVKGLKRLGGPGELCVVVPETNESFCRFFESQSFRLAKRFLSRRKNFDRSAL